MKDRRYDRMVDVCKVNCLYFCSNPSSWVLSRTGKMLTIFFNNNWKVCFLIFGISISTVHLLTRASGESKW